MIATESCRWRVFPALRGQVFPWRHSSHDCLEPPSSPAAPCWSLAAVGREMVEGNVRLRPPVGAPRGHAESDELLCFARLHGILIHVDLYDCVGPLLLLGCIAVWVLYLLFLFFSWAVLLCMSSSSCFSSFVGPPPLVPLSFVFFFLFLWRVSLCIAL